MDEEIKDQAQTNASLPVKPTEPAQAYGDKMRANLQKAQQDQKQQQQQQQQQ